jgi:hypothetical protein
VEAVQKIKLDPVGLSGMGIASETTGEREPRRTVKWESEVVKQCAVMFVNPSVNRHPIRKKMRAMGFVVHEITCVRPPPER